MAKKKRRKPEVMLSCTESTVPGMDWSTTVEFRTVGHQIEVWATLDIEEELDPVEEMIGRLPRPFSWRAAAQLLAASYHGSVGGNFFHSVVVHGLGGMEADVLALAWMHSEGWPSGSAIAAELLKLDDAALEELHASEGDFVTATFVEEIDRLVADVEGGLAELIPYCAQNPDEPLSLAALQGARERWQGDEGPPALRRVVMRRHAT